MYKLPTDDSWLTHFDLTAVVNAALVVNFAGSAARASATIISASSGANILDEEGMFESRVLGVGCSGRFSSARRHIYMQCEKNIFLTFQTAHPNPK